MGPILDLKKVKRKRRGADIENDSEPLQMDVLHMSLDDIIAARKQNKTGGLIGRDVRGGPGKRLARLSRHQWHLRQVVRRINSDIAIPTRIGITNLSYLVNESDLKSLFSEIGPIDYVTVYYNSYGSFLGMAEVIYKSRRDANAAIKRFNNVKLDNRKIHIHLLPDRRHTCSACFYSRQKNKRLQNVNANVRRRFMNANVRRWNKNANIRKQNGNSNANSTESNQLRKELDNELDEYAKRFSKISIL
ncbi:THO complex subunit 4B-like [Teleopsis dalmanni]|uniref:THO complex subunit 4B-like n=1 Tax=Teleopsis dalmanni TaxID=139649 RepID=UPI0018CCBED9|nr:THO complex subunit 4B-like [Teleopsis dalmanni]